jgi:hypothetical protein
MNYIGFEVFIAVKILDCAIMFSGVGEYQHFLGKHDLHILSSQIISHYDRNEIRILSNGGIPV